jgi:hypothetical protein
MHTEQRNREEYRHFSKTPHQKTLRPSLQLDPLPQRSPLRQNWTITPYAFSNLKYRYTRAVDGQENLQLVPCKDGFLQLHRYKIGLSRHARHTCVKQLQAAGPCLAGGVGSSLPSLAPVFSRAYTPSVKQEEASTGTSIEHRV